MAIDTEGLPNITTTTWSKSIGTGGDYSTWADMLQDMPTLLAHTAIITIKKGTVLTEECALRGKHGTTVDGKVRVEAEKYFPTSGADIPTATGGSSTTLVDTNQTWTVDEFIDCWIFIVDGTGTDNGFVQITDNDATSLTVSSWPGTQPDNTSRYIIVGALIDGGGTIAYPLFIDNNTAKIIVRGIGIKGSDYYGVRLERNIEVEFQYCGVYDSDQAGFRPSATPMVSIWWCGIVNNNTDDNSTRGGIWASYTNYCYVYRCGISDNNRSGVVIDQGSFGNILDNFGDGNTEYGTITKDGGYADVSTTACTGTSGEFSNTYRLEGYKSGVGIKATEMQTDPNAAFILNVPDYAKFNQGGTSLCLWTNGYMRFYDGNKIHWGTGNDYAMGYDSGTNTWQLVDGSTLNTNIRLKLSPDGTITIPTMTAAGFVKNDANGNLSGGNSAPGGTIKCGTTTTDGSGNAIVTFGTAFSDADFSISLTCAVGSDTYIAMYSNKATTGFGIKVENDQGQAGSSVTVDWIAIHL